MPPPRPPGLFNLHGNPDTIADLPSAPTYDSTAAAEPADLPRFTSLPAPGRPRTRGHLLPHVHIDGQRCSSGCQAVPGPWSWSRRETRPIQSLRLAVHNLRSGHSSRKLIQP